MIVIPTDHRDHSPSYEHEPFSCIVLKKSSTERLHNIYITNVMQSFLVFHPKSNQHHIFLCKNTDWTSISFSGLYDWIGFRVGGTLSYGKYDPVNSLQENKISLEEFLSYRSYYFSQYYFLLFIIDFQQWDDPLLDFMKHQSLSQTPSSLEMSLW